jgi:tRNA U34 5-carboxymethylaminomethyl modifying enzyme MnmG/GidA
MVRQVMREAASKLMAGINAHLKVKEKAPLILKGRSIHRSAD